MSPLHAQMISDVETQVYTEFRIMKANPEL